MRMGTKTRLALLALLALVVGLVMLWHDYRTSLAAPIDAERDRQIVIEPGMGASEIVDMLDEEGLIDNPIYLRFYLWESEESRHLQPGAYRVPAGTPVTELVQILTRGGRRDTVDMLVHAGTNLWELAEQLQELELADQDAFLRRVTDAEYAAALGVPAPSLEGYLMPGRYRFRRADDDVDTIITTMHGQFRDTWRELVAAHPDRISALRARHGMADHELVTLASMVEREAVVNDERPIISRVFFNRLATGMKLQSDPTCVYPPREVGERPTPSRCRDADNAYSTYVADGLPPGPIGAPSVASLRAVLSPYNGPRAEEYLFFVARNDGSWRHYFSASYDEHRQGVAFFLRGASERPPQVTPQPAR